jgi:hypothetical protein
MLAFPSHRVFAHAVFIPIQFFTFDFINYACTRCELCRPFGTHLINLTLPGTTVPGYRLFRPCGTASVAVSNPLAHLLSQSALRCVRTIPRRVRSAPPATRQRPRLLAAFVVRLTMLSYSAAISSASPSCRMSSSSRSASSKAAVTSCCTRAAASSSSCESWMLR